VEFNTAFSFPDVLLTTNDWRLMTVIAHRPSVAEWIDQIDTRIDRLCMNGHYHVPVEGIPLGILPDHGYGYSLREASARFAVPIPNPRSRIVLRIEIFKDAAGKIVKTGIGSA
jgi:hypothetical protein